MSMKATKNKETKKASPRAKRVPARESAAPAPSLDQVRDRAYQIFRNGANPKDPVADWLQAERELSSEVRA